MDLKFCARPDLSWSCTCPCSLFIRDKEEVFHETLCGLWIPSGVGQVFKNKQNPLANICLNVPLLLFIFHLHVGCGKMHFNPNSVNENKKEIAFSCAGFYQTTSTFGSVYVRMYC